MQILTMECGRILSKNFVNYYRFELPGGKIKLKNEEDETILPPITGKLNKWGALTEVLADTLEELQKSGPVHNPRPLFNQLTKKWPQFDGGDQHDSHELLRHLLESVKYVTLSRVGWNIINGLFSIGLVVVITGRRICSVTTRSFSGFWNIKKRTFVWFPKK